MKGPAGRHPLGGQPGRWSIGEGETATGQGGRYLHPNPRVEAIGARDHWAVERIAGAPVSRPSQDGAVEALRKAAAERSPRADGS